MSRTVPLPMTRSDGRPLIRQVRYESTSTGLVATRMIPSGLASAICGTSCRKIAAFFWTRSMRVLARPLCGAGGDDGDRGARAVVDRPGPDACVPGERDGVHEVHRLALGLPLVRVDEQDLGREAGQQQTERERRADGAGPDDGDPGRVRRGERVERLRGGHAHTVVHPDTTGCRSSPGVGRRGSRPALRESDEGIGPALAVPARDTAHVSRTEGQRDDGPLPPTGRVPATRSTRRVRVPLVSSVGDTAGVGERAVEG